VAPRIPVVIEPIADVTLSHDTAVDRFEDPFERQCTP